MAVYSRRNKKLTENNYVREFNEDCGYSCKLLIVRYCGRKTENQIWEYNEEAINDEEKIYVISLLARQR